MFPFLSQQKHSIPHITNIHVQTISMATRRLTYVLGNPMIAFGFIGSILTLLVFTRSRTFWQNPTITATHLPFIYLLIALADGFGIVLFNYFLYVTTISAVCFPCLADFDQYICTREKAALKNRFHNMEAVRLAICGTFLFWSIFFLPMFIFLRTC